jgi:cell division protein FtsB
MKLNIAFIAIIIGLVLYMFFGHNGLLKYQELVKIKNNYERQIMKTEKKVKDLKNELRLVRKDVEYLEMLIKKELSLKKEDEDLYIIERPSETKENNSDKK